MIKSISPYFFKYRIKVIRGLLACILTIPIGAHAQSTVKEFFTADGEVTDSDHAYYYLTGIKQMGDKNAIEHYTDTIKTFYVSNNTLRSQVYYSPDGMDGRFVSFHENGKWKERSNYVKGKKVGYVTTYYNRGNPQKIVEYYKDDKTISKYFTIDFKIINYWDSLGNPLVSNGNGYCNCYLDAASLREKGSIKDGLRDSVWTGIRNDTLSFVERYEKGIFIDGIRYIGNKEVPYQEIEVPAEFPGGMAALYSFIGNNVRYSKYARRHGIDGKVMTQFIVNTDGSISDIKTLKGLHESMDKEAIRVIELMPKWSPGKIRGKPVRSRFLLPMKFQLEN